jgi:ABC-type uncharacterized transport system auxiliary subunit
MKFLIVGLSVSILSACSSGLHRDVEPTQRYVLRAPAIAAVAPGKAVLRISRTSASPGLDTDRIVLLRDGQRIDHFAASRWFATAPEMVEALAQDSLRASAAWGSVLDSRSAFPADHVLQINIRHFAADYADGAAPLIRVVLDCTFERREDAADLMSFSVSGSAQARENRLAAIVPAFENALQQALTELVQHSLKARQ